MLETYRNFGVLISLSCIHYFLFFYGDVFRGIIRIPVGLFITLGAFVIALATIILLGITSVKMIDVIYKKKEVSFYYIFDHVVFGVFSFSLLFYYYIIFMVYFPSV